MATRSQQLAATQAITNFASGYASDQIAQSVLQDAMFLTGEPMRVATNFEFQTFDRGDGISVPNTKTSANDPVGAILAFGGSKTSGTLDCHRATLDWYDAGPQVTDADLLLQIQSGAKLATQALVTGRFQRILSAASTAAGSPTTIDISDHDAIAKLQEQVENVLLACGGYCQVRILLGAQAYRLLTGDSEFQNRISGGATVDRPSTPSDDQIARAIGYNVSVKTTTAVYNSAAAGQTATGAFLLSTSAYIAAVSPSPNTMDPSAIKLFTGYGANEFSPTFEAHGNGVHERATWGWFEKVVATNSSAIKAVTFQA